MELIDDNEIRKRVTMEIGFLGRLTHHEHIIPMREWFENDDNFIIIFDRPKNHKDLFGEFLLREI
jgi:serine/threonine protein kinase